MINYSIIIPHKNSADLLQYCLNSIPVRDDVQVIVVDDNSDVDKVDFDHFPQWRGKHYEIYFTKEGRGAGYARNVGLEHAVGKWVLFVDADDFLSEDANRIFNENVDNNADIIFFSPSIVMLSDRRTPSNRDVFLKEIIEKYKLTQDETGVRTHFVCPVSKLIKHSLIVVNQIKFDETTYANDVTFSVKTGCLAAEVIVKDEEFYVITESNNSLTSGFCTKPGELELRAKILFNACEYMVAHGYKIDETRVFNMLGRFFKKDEQSYLKYFALLCKLGYNKYELIWKLVKHNKLSSKIKRIPYLLYITRHI